MTATAPTHVQPSASVASASAAQTGPRPTIVPARRGRALAVLRIAFGLVWAVDAWFKWQPAFIHGFTAYLTGAKSGQPAVVKGWIGFWVSVVKVNPSLFAHLVAIAETTVALSLIFGVFLNLAYLNGSILAVLVWSTAEGFGGPYKAGSTDIGAAIIYLLVFAGLYLGNSGQYFSLQPLLSRWRRRGGAEPSSPSTMTLPTGSTS